MGIKIQYFIKAIEEELNKTHDGTSMGKLNKIIADSVIDFAGMGGMVIQVYDGDMELKHIKQYDIDSDINKISEDIKNVDKLSLTNGTLDSESGENHIIKTVPTVPVEVENLTLGKSHPEMHDETNFGHFYDDDIKKLMWEVKVPTELSKQEIKDKYGSMYNYVRTYANENPNDYEYKLLTGGRLGADKETFSPFRESENKKKKKKKKKMTKENMQSEAQH